MDDNTKHHKRIQTFVRRAGRMSPGQHRAYETFAPRFSLEKEPAPWNIEKIFPDKDKVIMEIGFGMGEATIELAEKNPDIGYIALEVHKPGIGKLLLNIDEKELINIRFMEYDALIILNERVKEESIDGFHIFFPDPWPKKKHHKRRLINQENVKLICSRLKPGGYIYAVTDWENYAEQIQEVLTSEPELETPPEGFSIPRDWRPTTRYEKKGLEKSHHITELFFTKRGG